MELVTLGLGVSTLAMVPLGAAVKKSYSNEKRLAVLETNDVVAKEAIVRIEAKLDRLIERFL
jgi:hypothetical protein